MQYERSCLLFSNTNIRELSPFIRAIVNFQMFYQVNEAANVHCIVHANEILYSRYILAGH